MNQLPQKLKAPEGCAWNEESPHFKINEILSYLESQKEGEGPKQIDVVKLCDELYGLGRWYDRCLNPEESEGRKKEIINTLKALQQ